MAYDRQRLSTTGFGKAIPAPSRHDFVLPVCFHPKVDRNDVDIHSMLSNLGSLLQVAERKQGPGPKFDLVKSRR